MSHIVQINVEMKDAEILKRAVARVEGAKLINEGELGKHRLYSSQEVYGVGLTLPGYNFPVVVNPETGKASYDNYHGQWGPQIRLDELVQAYGVEAAVEQARAMGHMAEEQAQENGDIHVLISDYS